MATTAYSKSLRRELDAGQLVDLYSKQIGLQKSEGSDQFELWRAHIKDDVVCASCGATGGQVVKAGHSRATGAIVRQPHFRFLSPAGTDAHSPFCEFYEANDDEPQEAFDLVSFGKAKTKETIFIRNLVCKAIEAGVFDQSHIRSMRQFFFDLKAQSRKVVDIPSGAIDWAWDLGHHAIRHYHNLPFHPSHAELPDFDWDQAARISFADTYGDQIKRCRGLFRQNDLKGRASKLIDLHQGKEVFDASVLRPYYEATLSMCIFVGRYGGMGYAPSKVDDFRWKGASSPILALCALLLHVSEWDINGAVEKIAAMLRLPEPLDGNLGNVVGLNPFNDYRAWETVWTAGEVEAARPAGATYASLMAEIEGQLREDYRVWKLQR